MKPLLKLMVALSAGLICGPLMAQAPLPAEIETPECLGINKEPAHATLMPYASLKEALAAKRHASSLCRSLNGTWKFFWVPEPSQRPVEFYKTAYDVSQWKDIPVPSNWQLLGYGTPYYRNLGYTFKADWPHVLTEPPKNFTSYKERDPVGSYRRDFELPADWQGRRVFLTFDGVDSAFFLWINGEKVGYSVNSRNAAEFDVTKYVKPGKNMVAAEVYRYCAGSYIEDQDMWRLSGIFRNVTLWTAPQAHIRDFFVNTDLDAQYKDATLLVTTKIRDYGDQPATNLKVVAQLYDAEGKAVAGAQDSAVIKTLAAHEEQSVSFKIPVANPAKWTAETPNLYTTVLTLQSDQGQELISTRTGFRKVEIKGRVFTINGVPVKLKGANRHENWPDSGHYVPEEKMIRDLEVLKQGNCNHVRTCHYSDDPRWYELCDEWGIYLNAEANVECHGYYGVLDREPRYEKAIVDRNVANVENFKNHASVVMWSEGNENGGGTNFVSALKAIKAIDTSRPVHYEPFGIGNRNPADVDSQMYTHPNDVERIALNKDLTKPFYMCEYAHAMFNSMGSIGEYNDIFDKYPSLMGGAIWEWQDQGIWNRRDTNHIILAYGGGFGEVPNDHYFIHKGVVFSDRSPKPHYPEMKRAYQWIGISAGDLARGELNIRNKYAFISLDQFEASWTITQDGKVIDKGSLPRLTLAAGTEGRVTVPFKNIAAKPGVESFLRVSFKLAKDQRWAKAGYEVAAAQFALAVKSAATITDVTKLPAVKLDQNDKQITISTKDFAIVFDKAEGTISQITRDNHGLLAANGGPRMHLWRAPHRNDDMWAYQEWERTGLSSLKFSTVCINATQPDASTVRVEAVVKGEGKSGFALTHSAIYTIYGDGTIAVDNAIVTQGRRIALGRVGVRLQLDKAMDQFQFLGRGPMETYADRKRGFDIGVYSSSVREQMTPYAKPMECGNHEDVRWAALSGKGMPALMAQTEGEPLQVSALPYTDEVMTPIEYTIDLPKSASTVMTIAARTLGAGSAGCGPRPLDQYIPWSDPATFSYVLKVLPAGTRDFAAKAHVLPPQNRVKPVIAQRDQNGRVTLVCTTPSAKLEYSFDGAKWSAFAGPVEFETAGAVFVRGSADGMLPYEGAVVIAAPSSRTKWKILSASSVEEGEGDAIHAIDGMADTFWHSHWSGQAAQPPHWLAIDFSKQLNVASVVYTARADMDHGRVKDYEIYLSNDPNNWGEPAAKGQFRARGLTQTIKLTTPVQARYMKFVVLSEQTTGGFATIAELDVVEAK